MKSIDLNIHNKTQFFSFLVISSLILGTFLFDLGGSQSQYLTNDIISTEELSSPITQEGSLISEGSIVKLANNSIILHSEPNILKPIIFNDSIAIILHTNQAIEFEIIIDLHDDSNNDFPNEWKRKLLGLAPSELAPPSELDDKHFENWPDNFEDPEIMTIRCDLNFTDELMTPPRFKITIHDNLTEIALKEHDNGLNSLEPGIYAPSEVYIPEMDSSIQDPQYLKRKILLKLEMINSTEIAPYNVDLSIDSIESLSNWSYFDPFTRKMFILKTSNAPEFPSVDDNEIQSKPEIYRTCVKIPSTIINSNRTFALIHSDPTTYIPIKEKIVTVMVPQDQAVVMILNNSVRIKMNSSIPIELDIKNLKEKNPDGSQNSGNEDDIDESTLRFLERSKKPSMLEFHLDFENTTNIDEPRHFSIVIDNNLTRYCTGPNAPITNDSWRYNYGSQYPINNTWRWNFGPNAPIDNETGKWNYGPNAPIEEETGRWNFGPNAPIDNETGKWNFGPYAPVNTTNNRDKLYYFSEALIMNITDVDDENGLKPHLNFTAQIKIHVDPDSTDNAYNASKQRLAYMGIDGKWVVVDPIPGSDNLAIDTNHFSLWTILSEEPIPITEDKIDDENTEKDSEFNIASYPEITIFSCIFLGVAYIIGHIRRRYKSF